MAGDDGTRPERGAAPRVSICIPVYNREAQLERALRSACEQTFRDLEIIVVDNASTDGSADVALRRAASDDRVRVVRNETTLDKTDNWWKALTLARGTYVKLLFSDDWIAPEAVGRSVDVLDGSPDVGFVYSAMTWHTGDRANTCYAAPTDADEPAEDFLYRSASIADLVPVTTSCVLMRRTDALEAFEQRIPARLADDTHRLGLGYSGTLLWRIARRYPRVHHLGRVLAHSADAPTGERGSRERYADRAEMLWWGHRNAFAHFADDPTLPRRVRQGLITVMFLHTVPVGRSATRKRLAGFRRLFPGFRPHHLRPWRREARPHLRRLATPPDPLEILGPNARPRRTPHATRTSGDHA